MTVKNTSERWGSVAKFFHWSIAVLVIGMLALGLYMAELPPVPSTFRLFALHKSFGMIVLALMVLRLLWRSFNARPEEMAAYKQWERILARIIHWFLYAAVIAMPLSGWIMSSAKNFHVGVFGLFTLPDLVGPDKALAEQAEEFHETLAWCIIAALALHVVGALKHHIIDRDSTLRRMLPFAKV